MTPEETKERVSVLLSNIDAWKKEKDMHEAKAMIVIKLIEGIHAELNQVRAQCKHTYLGKPLTHMMGRGVCEICGDNDY